jgi:hypothetical protein
MDTPSVTRFLLYIVPAPLGWMLGMLIARRWVGPDIVAPPLWAVPLGLAVAYALAFMPYAPALARLIVILLAAGGLFALTGKVL